MKAPRFAHKESFRVIGISCLSTLRNNTIPALWDEFNKICGTIPGMVEPHTALGICYYEKMEDMTEDTPFTYLAGMEVVSTQEAPAGLESRDVPAADYAVFEHQGSLDTLQQTYASIYEDWFPQSGYQRKVADDFELYDSRFQFGKPESVMEIWIPIEPLV